MQPNFAQLGLKSFLNMYTCRILVISNSTTIFRSEEGEWVGKWVGEWEGGRVKGRKGEKRREEGGIRGGDKTEVKERKRERWEQGGGRRRKGGT